ncbi:MAG: flavin oxidoreductase [Cereibacter sphaeroides]|uniref:Flavin oxidoreductase n=1 Tax=Cereibacter sphaeroides TaxID=1063 RepID=A0A2W5SJG6_CERSP|nr:MAG: flavin oxidoreductase [Cereibacter sphaeroides]
MKETGVAAETTDERALRDAFGRFATGVAVVTIPTLDGPMGFTANSFASVSLDPPLVLWSPARSAIRFPYYAAAELYAIHILGAEQLALSRRFVRGGIGFDGLPYEENAEGVPVIPGTLARFDCVREAAHDGGDHLIIIGRVLRAMARPGAPLIFNQGAYGRFDPGL